MTSRHQPPVRRFVLTDAKRGGDPFDQLRSLTTEDALILRHYEVDRSERLALALSLRQATRALNVRFLIAADQNLALQARADGLHLPSWMIKRGHSWRTRPTPDWIITAAAHNERELRAAEQSGADAALVSPVFSTASHPGAATLGAIRLAHLTQQTHMPVYALGGVTANTLKRLRGVVGLAGWATVSAA